MKALLLHMVKRVSPDLAVNNLSACRWSGVCRLMAKSHNKLFLLQVSPASSKGKGSALAGRSRKRPVVLSDSEDESDVSVVKEFLHGTYV